MAYEKPKSLYYGNTDCLNFTNNEIKEFLINKVSTFQNFDIVLKSDNDKILDSNTTEKIRHVVFDGKKEEFFVSFYSHQTSLYFDNQEIMFIDDFIKQNITSSDTDYNIVYEGTLRDKTHEEILSLIVKIITLIAGYKSIEVKYNAIPAKNRKWYPYFENTIIVGGKNEISKTIFENITIKCI